MRDPRIDQLMLRRDETDARGVPTRVAELAGKVSSLLVEIDKLRAEVEVANRQVMTLAARESTLRKVVESSRRPGSLTDGSSALAFDSRSEFQVGDEPDFEFQQERLETIGANLKSRRLFVQRTQDLIATRITTVQRLLDLFTKFEEGQGSRTRKRRRVRRVRRRR